RHRHAHQRSAHLPRLASHRGHAGEGLPARPAPRRTERRAALPHIVRTHRTDPGPRHGSRHMAAMSGTASGLTPATRPIEPAGFSTLFSCEHPMISGRGPPRAGPLRITRASAVAPAVSFAPALPPRTRP